jgi:hypothetical protein
VRRWAALLAAAGVTLAAVVPAAPAARAQDATPVAIRLLSRTPWVGDGTDFALSVRVVGAPADARLRLRVHDRVRNRIEYARTARGEGLRTAVWSPADEDLGTLDPDGDGTLTIGVPLGGQPGIAAAPITREGVYPVELQVRDGDGAEVATLNTHLVRLPALDPSDDDIPLDVVVVLPITAPPVHVDAEPGAAPAAPAFPLTEVAAVLREHPGVAVTLAPNPETVAGAAAADPDGVAALAAAAATSGRQVLAAPWVELDEAAWRRTDEVELGRQLALGRQALTDHLGTTADGTRLVPTGATLAEVQSMVAGGATALVVSDDDLSPLDAGDFPFTVTRPVAVATGDDGTAVPALVGDTALGDAAAQVETDPVLAAHRVLADLALLASDQPAVRRVATLVLPPAAAGSLPFLEALLAGLEPPPAPPAPVPSADPNVPTPPAAPAPAAVVVARPAGLALAEVEPAGAGGEPDPEDPLVRTVADTSEPTGVATVARQVAEGRADLATVRAVFGPGDDLLPSLEPVVATAAAESLRPGARQAALGGVRRAVEEQVAGLRAPAEQQVTLTAREGRIQLLLTNDTGRTANVLLLLRGDRLVLPDAPDGRLPVRLEEQSTRVELQVEARSSGDTRLDVVLVTPDERIELGRAGIRVRTTAVSGVGVALLASSAAFLVVWWTRTILRERRTARSRHPAHARRART